MDRTYGQGIERGRPSGIYSSRIQPPPPPLYTVDEGLGRSGRRPEYHEYRQSSKHAPAPPETISETSSSSSDDYTVENPPEGMYRAWLVVLICAILHACNELVYFMFYNTTVIAPLRNLRLVAGAKSPVSTYTDFQVFEDVRLFGEFFAALTSIFTGYRFVAAFGSILTGAGFFAASFIKDTGDNVELMGFLVGFLGGLGCSFWRFAAYVAVMEYFKKNRMPALVLSGLGRVVGIFIGYGILAVPLRQVLEPDTTITDIEDMTEWHIYYKCILVPAGVAFFASLVVRPLDMWQERTRYFAARQALKLRDWSLCGSGFFWLTMLVYFLYYFAESLPNTSFIGYMLLRTFATRFILAGLFTLACGVTLGYIMLLFWPRKTRFFGTIMPMGFICLVLGLLTLQLPVFNMYQFSYVGAYVAVLGVGQVVFETVLRYVVPIAFSRQYIRLVEGMLGLMAGCATICNNFIAKELAETGPEYTNNVYYWAGSAFLAAGLVALVTAAMMRCCKVSDPDLEKNVPVPKRIHHKHRSSRRGRGREYDRDDPHARYAYGNRAYYN